MSFLPLSYSTTSLSSTRSGCFTEASDSTGYTSDGRRDSSNSIKGNLSGGGRGDERADANGQEDEMREFLLGPGWVRVSFLLYRLDYFNRDIDRELAFLNSTTNGFQLQNA